MHTSLIKATLATVAILSVPFAVSAGSKRDVDPNVPETVLVAPKAARRATAEIPLSIARIYWEYNASANDLGVHVFLDGEDWKRMEIEDPLERLLFSVVGKRGYATYGMTELFFEGAEPSLDEVPLATLLGLFPEGQYEFSGITVSNEEIESIAVLSHGIPAAPMVAAKTGPNNSLVISWAPVSGNPPGFPVRPVVLSGFQVILKPFQVTVPPSVLSVTVPPEFVATLPAGAHQFEVLAIDVNGNQTITESYVNL